MLYLSKKDDKGVADVGEYKLLSRIYHDVKLRDTYTTVYEQRFNGDSTYKLPLAIKDTSTAEDMQLFVVLTPEIYETTIQINVN